MGMDGTAVVWLLLPDRRCGERDAASICFLVCWCIEREYVGRSAGGGGEAGMDMV